MKSRTFTFQTVIPIKTISELNRRGREHWAVRSKRAKSQREATHVCMMAAGSVTLAPSFRASVTLTRLAPRSLDVGDNLNSSCKSIRDQIARWLGADDSDLRVTWVYDQEKSKTYGVRVEVSMFENAEAG